MVQVFEVGHYNPLMVSLFKTFQNLQARQILGCLDLAFLRQGLAILLPMSLLGLIGLSGCGQKGPLFIPVPPVTASAMNPSQPAVLQPAAAPASSAR